MIKKLFKQSANGAAIPAGKRIYAIGDVHGALDALNKLLDKIDRDAEGLDNAKLIFLGDYVDRGPASRGVIERLIELQKTDKDHVFLRGNHEAVMLDFLKDPEEIMEWLEWGGDETLRSYGVSAALSRSGEELSDDLADAMPKSHREFLDNLPLVHREGDYVFVHAGIRPGVSLDEQNEEDLMWIRGQFHNAAESERPDGIVIVHGHHPMKKPLDAGWRIGVDTGACWSGTLTALVLDGNQRRFLST